MSDLLNQASLVMIPSGYKEDVVYSQIPTSGAGDMSFTRASNGTRVNSAGLVEVCPWNLLQQSETFDVSPWGYSEVAITANATTAPNGTTTADKLKTTTANAGHQLFQSFTNENANHTFSIYAKKGELNYIQLALGNSIEQYANFNLNTGVVGTKGSYCASSLIESVGDGWYRCTAYFNQGTMPTLMLWLTNSASSDWGGIVSWAGANNTDGIYIWGAQLNIGSTAKPYFPTTDRLNVPRLTYQNGGGGCPSLLLEKQSTNILTYSEDFSNAAWAKLDSGSGSTTPVVTANYAISPDGTQNADRLQCTLGSSGYSLIQQSPTVSGTHTGSIWVKSNTSSNQNVYFRVSANSTAYVVTPEWQRINITEANGDYLTIGLRDQTGYTNYSCDILIWGAQLEASSYPTSYIPTTSSSATRVADLGSNDVFGSTYTLDADFCLFQDFECFDFANFPVFWSGGNYATGGDYRSYMIGYNTSNVTLFGINEVQTAQLTAFTFAPNTRYKLAVRRVGSTINWFVNGTKYSNTTGTTTTTVKIRSISGASLGGQNAMKLNEAIIFEDKTLTDAECIALTTI